MEEVDLADDEFAWIDTWPEPDPDNDTISFRTRGAQKLWYQIRVETRDYIRSRKAARKAALEARAAREQAGQARPAD